MTDLSDFFSDAWQTIGRAIAMACISAGLREVPETISKTVKHRCQAELKRLGSLLRRLIFLMALHVQLAPVKPRLGSNYFETDRRRDEVEIHLLAYADTGGRGAGLPAWADHVPDARPGACCAADRPLAGHARSASGRRAKCLARTLQRQQAQGAPKPTSFPFQRPTPCTAPWPSSQAGSPSS
jgi:hypothetical protein